MAVGNFTYLVLFARYLSNKGFKIYFYLITNKTICGQSNKEVNKKKYIFEFMNALPKLLIKKNLRSFEILDWRKATNKFKNRKHYILFEDLVYRREGFTSHLFYLLNKLVVNENRKFIDKFLLTEKDFKKFKNKKINNFIKKRYISVIFRSDKFNILRNTGKKEINKICKSIKKKFPEKNILLISDKVGCQNAKKFLNNQKGIFFSMDYSNSIFSHIFLQLRSDICIASHNSGGMLTWHFFSKKIFCCSHYMGTTFKLAYNAYYKLNQNHSWWHKKQLFLPSVKLNDLTDLIKKL